MTERAAIGLGTNLGDRAGQIESAFAALERLGRVAARSSLYATAPWGVPDQPEFLNAVAVLETELPPLDLLVSLKALETELGREPGERWGPRAIDLDILTYGDRVINSEALTVPHPRLLERAFVLAPLSEIDPAYEAALAALDAVQRDGVERYAGGTLEPKVEGSALMSDTPLPAGFARVRRYIERFAQSELTALKIDRPGLSLGLRRRAAVAASAHLPGRNGRAVLAGDAAASHMTGDPAALRTPDDGTRPDILVADLVGIVRLSRPAPTVGDVLHSDRELGCVEALGIRNPVRSRGPGRVVEIFVEDGAAVDFGRPLFAIARV